MSKQLKRQKGKYLTFEGIELFMPIMKESETTDSEICLLLEKFLFWTNNSYSYGN